MSAPTGYSTYSPLTGGHQGGLQQLLSMLGGTGAQGFEQALQSLLGMLSGSPESYEAFEAPMMRQFEEQTVPMLQERLTGQFGAGGGRSSGGAQILGQAGAGLQENLASQRAGLQQNAIQQLLGTYLQGTGLGLGTQAQGFAQKPPGFGASFGQGLGQGAGSLFGKIPGLFF